MADLLGVDMKKKGVAMPDIFSSLDLIPMTNRGKRNSMKNINIACDKFLAQLRGHFLIEQDEMLHEWQLVHLSMNPHEGLQLLKVPTESLIRASSSDVRYLGCRASLKKATPA